MVDITLKGPVGAFIPARNVPLLNDFGDQALVVTLLYAIPPSEGGAFGELLPLITSRVASPQLAERIKFFQERWVTTLNAEDAGVVRPRSPTLRKLISLAPAGLADIVNSGDYEIEVTPEGVGDGHREGSIPVAEPNSLFSGQARVMASASYATTIRLVKVTRKSTRFWFGVAIPDGCDRFDVAHVYFHPTAKTEFYPDADYNDFTGNWRYLHRNNLTPVAQQVAGAIKVPVIVPYMRNSAAVSPAANPLAHDAAGILDAVLMACQRIGKPGDIAVPKVKGLSVSSFSAGINYMLASLPHLRATGTVREIIDLDSPFISTAGNRFLPGLAPRMVQIAQIERPPPFRGALVRPASWWGHPDDLNGMFETHQSIFNQALFGALTRSALK